MFNYKNWNDWVYWGMIVLFWLAAILLIVLVVRSIKQRTLYSDIKNIAAKILPTVK